jgi:hypothetical protein
VANNQILLLDTDDNVCTISNICFKGTVNYCLNSMFLVNNEILFDNNRIFSLIFDKNKHSLTLVIHILIRHL